MGTLKIVRRLEWFGMLRRVKVEVDGENAGSLRARGSLELDLPAGVHQVQALRAWVGSPVHGVTITDDAVSIVGISLPYRDAMAATGRSNPGGRSR